MLPKHEEKKLFYRKKNQFVKALDLNTNKYICLRKAYAQVSVEKNTVLRVLGLKKA